MNVEKLCITASNNLPEFEDYEYFIEGTNITGLLEDRLGFLVREMYNMTSTLIECGITKDEVI